MPDYSIFANPKVPDWQPVIDAQGYAKAANAYAGGDTKGAMNALIGIGQAGQAGALNQMRIQNINAANTASDRKRAAGESVLKELGYIASLPDLNEGQWGQTIDLLKRSHPEYGQVIEQYRDFNAGLPLLRGKLGITPKTLDPSMGAKFGTTAQYYRDPVTNELKIGQLSTAGGFRPVQVPGQLAPPLIIKDTGTAQTVISPRTGEVVSSVPKQVEEAARLGKRGQEIGKYEGEKVRLFPKARQALGDLERDQNIALDDIDRALKLINTGLLPKTGVFSLASFLPGTPQYDLAQLILGLKAKVGFDKLQSMRESSPTGGALGNVSDRETALLQAVAGSLSEGQRKEQLVYNLQRLKRNMLAMRAQRRAAFQSDFADFIGKGGAPARPAPGRMDTGIEARATLKGKNYVKRNGQWFEE